MMIYIQLQMRDENDPDGVWWIPQGMNDELQLALFQSFSAYEGLCKKIITQENMVIQIIIILG
jgi:hypothetical protein